PAWLDEPILRDTFSPEEIRLLGESFTNAQSPEARASGEINVRNIRKLKAAGARLVLGTDTGGVSGGQYFGLGSQIELELLVTRRFAPPSPSGRGIVLKSFPLPLGEGGAKRRVRVEFRERSDARNSKRDTAYF